MKSLHFSFIIPVFNRPVEVHELLESFTKLSGDFKFEIVIVEDGSTETAQNVVENYTSKLNISYYYKPNSGPGDSRNFGMKRAKGNYFIILDSDCVLPSHYLSVVSEILQIRYLDFFGGPDAAHPSFSNLQKAINFAMTSFITTGGIRGNKAQNFQPRSFNMGISKEAFEASGGFGNLHPGEDPDLTIRLWNLGFKSGLIKQGFVYHKRRISWSKFYTQVHKFGMVRAILNDRYPKYKRVIYWFPTVFLICFLLAFILVIFNNYLLLIAYAIYTLLAFCLALVKERSLLIAVYAIIAIAIQFFGYGYGFLKSSLAIEVFNKKPEEAFPKLFFKLNK